MRFWSCPRWPKIDSKYAPDVWHSDSQYESSMLDLKDPIIWTISRLLIITSTKNDTLSNLVDSPHQSVCRRNVQSCLPSSCQNGNFYLPMSAIQSSWVHCGGVVLSNMCIATLVLLCLHICTVLDTLKKSTHTLMCLHFKGSHAATCKYFTQYLCRV